MKAKSTPPDADTIRPEYGFDYAKAVRGKYYRRLLKEGSNVVVLEADVARAFRASAAVNDALRSLLSLARETQRLTAPPSGSICKQPPAPRTRPAAERG
jgi:hypothetical protein